MYIVFEKHMKGPEGLAHQNGHAPPNNDMHSFIQYIAVLTMLLHSVLQAEVGVPAYVSRHSTFDLSVLATEDDAKAGEALLMPFPCVYDQQPSATGSLIHEGIQYSSDDQ